MFKLAAFSIENILFFFSFSSPSDSHVFPSVSFFSSFSSPFFHFFLYALPYFSIVSFCQPKNLSIALELLASHNRFTHPLNKHKSIHKSMNQLSNSNGTTFVQSYASTTTKNKTNKPYPNWTMNDFAHTHTNLFNHILTHQNKNQKHT